MKPSIEFDEAKHRYLVDGERYPSVTQVLGLIDKSGPLMWWAQGIGVKGVAQLHRQGVEIPWDDPEGIVKLLKEHKLTHHHVSSQAGTRGTSLHTALEAWMREERAPNAADFPSADRGYVQALARALVTLQPTVIATEVLVASTRYRFAGRYDLKCWVGNLPLQPGVSSVQMWDLKTSKQIYPETFLQLEAYALADEEMGEEPVDSKHVLRLGADGKFEYKRSIASADQFLTVLFAWQAVQDLREQSKVAA